MCTPHKVLCRPACPLLWVGSRKAGKWGGGGPNRTLPVSLTERRDLLNCHRKSSFLKSCSLQGTTVQEHVLSATGPGSSLLFVKNLGGTQWEKTPSWMAAPFKQQLLRRIFFSLQSWHLLCRMPHSPPQPPPRPPTSLPTYLHVGH